MVSGFMCAETDEEALEKASGWTFFVCCPSHYGKHGIPNPGEGNMWEAYQEWRHTDKAQETLRSGLIGSPETIRRRLREFEATGASTKSSSSTRPGAPRTTTSARASSSRSSRAR